MIVLRDHLDSHTNKALMADSEYWALTNNKQVSADDTTIPPQFVLPLLKRHISTPAAPPPAAPPLPIIDLGAQFDESASSRLHRACADWGIFLVVNHGVPHAVLQQMQTQIDQFLALPVALRFPRPQGNHGQGYGTGFFRLSSGVTEWRDFLRLSTFPLSRRDYNAWPLSPQFRGGTAYPARCGWGQGAAGPPGWGGRQSQNLGLRASRLEEIVGDMQQTILMNHYPPCPQPDLAAGVDQHTDVGAISCIWQQNDTVGLQVFHDGAWIPVAPIPGAIIVVLGDQMQIASNGTYKSSLHRGVLNVTKRRVSVVSFYQLRPEQVVAPAAELIDEQHPPLFRPTCFADHEAASKGKNHAIV